MEEQAPCRAKIRSHELRIPEASGWILPSDIADPRLGVHMTAPRKLYAAVLKSRVKVPPRKKVGLASPEANPVSFDILRKVIEEHRELTERSTNR
jgi:hypothetical protein